MMKYYQQILIACTVGILASCGGGGGSDSGSGGGNTNAAPTISGDAETVVRAEADYSFTPDASDPDNDGLVFDVDNLPLWASFDVMTGEIWGTPQEDDVGEYQGIVISVNDGEKESLLEPFSIKVMYPEVDRDDIEADQDAVVTETPEGFDLIGDASIQVGNLITEFKNADLQFEFDEEGNLLDLVGVTDLPPQISDNLSLQTSVQAIVGLYTGAEINANPDIGPDSEPGILLKDDFKYIVYFLDASIDLVFHPSTGPDVEIPLEVAGTRVLIMSDPTDPFFYYFGQVAGAEIGFGYSNNSNLPWVPQFDPDSPYVFAPFEPFDGQVVLKGGFPLGTFSMFELFQVNGEAICRPPQLFDCGKPTGKELIKSIVSAMVLDGGIDPSQQVVLGLNGGVDLQFTVFGIDLFSYELLDISAQAEVGTDRQAIALQGVLEPGNAQQPDWFGFAPAPDSGITVVANLFAEIETDTGDGDFGLSFYGEIDSFFPEARLEGTIDINPEGLQMAGIIDDVENPITVTTTVTEDELAASIEMDYDINLNIDELVDQAFDRAVGEFNRAVEDVDNATTDYNGAVSLNGFRSEIPTIIDEAITILDAIPQQVYDSVYSGARSGMNSNSASYTYTDPLFGTRTTFYARNYMDVDARAASWARRGRNESQADVDTRKAELENLRAEAERAEDTPAFRAALKSALLQIASRDRFTYSLTVRETVNFPSPVPDQTFTFYSYSTNVEILSSSTKSDLEIAAANVDDIDPAQTVMIDSQEYLDSIPTPEAIETMREEVQNNTRQIPEFKGAGYSITRSGIQTAYVDLGAKRVEITFNPLDPASVVDSIADLIVSEFE